MATDVLELQAPTESDAALAREARRQLDSYLKEKHDLQPRIALDEAGGAAVALPRAVLQVLRFALAQMEKGNAVTFVPAAAELTTQEAANLLNVPPPFLVQLLKTGALAHHQVGTSLRVLLRDLLEYKRKITAERLAALEELVQDGQDLDMGY